MRRDELSYLVVFLAVAEERSFHAGRHKIGDVASAIRQIVRRLELGMG